MTPREEAQRIIAEQLDLPSVYMGGPSPSSMRRADDILAALTMNGFEVVSS